MFKCQQLLEFKHLWAGYISCSVEFSMKKSFITSRPGFSRHNALIITESQNKNTSKQTGDYIPKTQINFRICIIWPSDVYYLAQYTSLSDQTLYAKKGSRGLKSHTNGQRRPIWPDWNGPHLLFAVNYVLIHHNLIKAAPSNQSRLRIEHVCLYENTGSIQCQS